MIPFDTFLAVFSVLINTKCVVLSLSLSLSLSPLMFTSAFIRKSFIWKNAISAVSLLLSELRPQSSGRWKLQVCKLLGSFKGQWNLLRHNDQGAEKFTDVSNWFNGVNSCEDVTFQTRLRKFTVGLRPHRLYGLLGTGSTGRLLRLPHSSSQCCSTSTETMTSRDRAATSTLTQFKFNAALRPQRP